MVQIILKHGYVFLLGFLSNVHRIFWTKMNLMKNGSISGFNGDIGLKSSANNLNKICNNPTAMYLFSLSFQIIKINFQFKI